MSRGKNSFILLSIKFSSLGLFNYEFMNKRIQGEFSEKNTQVCIFAIRNTCCMNSNVFNKYVKPRTDKMFLI